MNCESASLEYFYQNFQINHKPKLKQHDWVYLLCGKARGGDNGAR